MRAVISHERAVVALVLAAACACRAAPELPPVAADHPASSSAAETAAPELRGPSSDALKAAESAREATKPSMSEGGR